MNTSRWLITGSLLLTIGAGVYIGIRYLLNPAKASTPEKLARMRDVATERLRNAGYPLSAKEFHALEPSAPQDEQFKRLMEYKIGDQEVIDPALTELMAVIDKYDNAGLMPDPDIEEYTPPAATLMQMHALVAYNIMLIQEAVERKDADMLPKLINRSLSLINCTINDFSVISQLLGFGFYIISADAFSTALPYINEHELMKLSHRLTEIEEKFSLTIKNSVAFEATYLTLEEILSNPEEVVALYNSSNVKMIEQDIDRYIDLLFTIADVGKLEFYQIDENIRNFDNGSSDSIMISKSSISPRLLHVKARATALMRMTQDAIDLEIIRRKEGAYPQTFNTRTDPFTGEPIIYEPGIQLYVNYPSKADIPVVLKLAQ